jgi:NTP pyrophosphatase (non-canonical NTP hydrolase)
MKFRQYVTEVLKTESNDFEKILSRMGKERNIRLLHASMGVCTEIGELFEMFAKPKLDLSNLQEEVTDSAWYIGVAIDELKLDPDQFIEKVLTRVEKYSFLQRLFVRKQMGISISKATIASSQMLDLMKKGVFYGPKEGKPEIDL